MGGCGLGRVCDHINHIGYHIKEIRDPEGTREAAMLKSYTRSIMHIGYVCRMIIRMIVLPSVNWISV